MANLTQLRFMEGLNGLVLVDKPAGIAFASVVKAVKRKFNLEKVGHGGSLDALASGLFVLLINDANKFVGDIMGADRQYEGVMRLGLKTDTHDSYGHTLQERPVPDALPIEDVLPSFKGDLFQTEPPYCSIRKEGTASYEIAETGKHEPFLTHVYRFTLGERQAAHLPFSVFGTKSLLVRTLVNDFGDALGTGAVLESLRRVRIGALDVKQAMSFDALLKTEPKDFAACVTPLSKVSL